MKGSIQKKLFLQICAIVVFFLGLNWSINAYYLERYYVHQKKELLEKQAASIDQMNSGDYKQFANELRKLEDTHNLTIAIVSGADGRIRYSSHFKMIEEQIYFPDEDKFQELQQTRSLPPPPSPRRNTPYFYQADREQLAQGAYFEIQQDRGNNAQFLVHYSLLDNGDLMIIRVVLDAISESVAIANKFMLYISMVVLLIASGWAFFTSRKFVKPISEMNDVTQSMANLDFSRKCEVKTNDELEQLAHSINFLSEKLNKEFQMSKAFISNVSHELRTPISLIAGYAEGLKLNVPDDEKKIFYSDVIIDETQKMGRLVENLLNLAYMESAGFTLDKQVFPVGEFVEQVTEKYRELFAKEAIDFTITVDEEYSVCADSLRAEQVLTNYLTNALHHVDQRKQIRVTCERIDQKVKLTVYNSGDSIPVQELENIWNSFYKIDKARSREYGRYGLGLSIVKVIQEMDSNDYGVVNCPDGVEFWFTLDLAL